MSDGSLDYVSYRIEDAAQAVREWVEEHRADNPSDWTPHPHFVKENPDAPYLQSAEALKARTLELMKATAHNLELAAKMAHEAEWMMSDDTGPETFCREVEKAVVEWMDAGHTEEEE